MKLTIGTTYKVVATPNDGYRCTSITITGLESQPTTDVDDRTGVGTCTFKMTDKVEAIDAEFEVIVPPTPEEQEVTIGDGNEEPEGTALSTDKLGKVKVALANA